MGKQRTILVVGPTRNHSWNWMIDLAIRFKTNKEIVVKIRQSYGEMTVGNRIYKVCQGIEQAQGHYGEFIFLSGAKELKDYPELLARSQEFEAADGANEVEV